MADRREFSLTSMTDRVRVGINNLNINVNTDTDIDKQPLLLEDDEEEENGNGSGGNEKDLAQHSPHSPHSHLRARKLGVLRRRKKNKQKDEGTGAASKFLVLARIGIVPPPPFL